MYLTTLKRETIQALKASLLILLSTKISLMLGMQLMLKSTVSVTILMTHMHRYLMRTRQISKMQMTTSPIVLPHLEIFGI